MIHLIFCFRHAAQALTLREIPGSFDVSGVSLLVLLFAVLNVLTGGGRGAALLVMVDLWSSSELRDFLGECV